MVYKRIKKAELENNSMCKTAIKISSLECR